MPIARYCGLDALKQLYEWLGIGSMPLAALAYAIAPPWTIAGRLPGRRDLSFASASDACCGGIAPGSNLVDAVEHAVA
jgi:hypothetical protein